VDKMPDMTISLKMETGKTSIRHNNRTLTEEEYLEPAHSHIIRERTKDNIVIKQEPIAEAYKKLFDDEVAKYNEGKKPCRQISNYYKHVQKSKTLNTQKEMIIGVGSKEDWDLLTYEDKKRAGQAIAKYVEEFMEANKNNIYVYNATVHLDEAGAPHAHINFVPLAHGYKNGLKTQPSWSKALDQLGYKGKSKAPFIAFRKAEVERVEKIINEIGITRKLGKTNDIANVQAYKEVKRLEEQAKAKEAEIGALEQEYSKKDRELKSRAFEQAKALSDFNEKLESKVKSKESELEQLDSELAEKQAKAEKAGASAYEARLEAQNAQQDKEQAQGEAESLKSELERLKTEKKAVQEQAEKLKAQAKEAEQALSEKEKVLEQKSQLLSQQESKLAQNESFLQEQDRRFDEQTHFIERRAKALQGLENASRVTYSDENVRPNGFNPNEVIIKKAHYKNLKQRAGFFDSLKDFATDLVSTIQETSVYKALEAKMTAEINKWKRAYQSLKEKVTELEDKVDSQNDELFELYTERDNLRDELKEEQELREKLDKYLKPREKEELAAKIERREQRHQEAIKQKNQGYRR
jgi:mob